MTQGFCARILMKQLASRSVERIYVFFLRSMTWLRCNYINCQAYIRRENFLLGRTFACVCWPVQLCDGKNTASDFRSNPQAKDTI